DPFALLSNVSNPQHYSPSSSASSSTQVPPPLAESISPAEDLIENLTNTLALLTQSYRTFLPQTNNQLRTSSNARNQATVQDGRVVVQNVQGHPNRGQGMNPQGRNAVGYGGAPNRVGNNNQGQAKPSQARTAQENGVALDAEQLLFITGGQDNVFDDDVDEQLVHDLALNMDNVFQADDYEAFDSDVDEAPTAQTLFMANLSSADPVTDEAGPSYDLNILSEVPDYKHYLDAACVHHEGHVTHDNIQLDRFVDSHADYTSDSHMILYDQYVKDNEVPVVHCGASSVPTDAFMMIYNDIISHQEARISFLFHLVKIFTISGYVARATKDVKVFESWYPIIDEGKENGVNILKSTDEGPYKMGTFRETLAESTEGTPQFGPERPRVYSDLNSKEKDQYNADIWATNILLQVGPVAYRLDLPKELNGVQDTFHMSNLKKCLVDPTLQVPLDEIQVDAKLNFMEEPLEILDREFKKLKRIRIAIIKNLYRVDSGELIKLRLSMLFIGFVFSNLVLTMLLKTSKSSMLKFLNIVPKGDLEDMGVASIVTSPSSSGTISKHLLSSAVSSSATSACTFSICLVLGFTTLKL
nr:hypothetical protein [Tanacetum cinerariifolium]